MALYNNFPIDSLNNFIVNKDRVDSRDLICKAVNNNLSNIVDLRKWCSPIEDQLHLGSCVAQAIVGAFELMINKSYPGKFKDLSRLFLYYNARLLDGYTEEDVGVYVRDGIKAVNKWGICAEDLWPYLIKKFADIPMAESYIDAKTRLIDTYKRIETVDDMISTINTGFPIVSGIQVFNGFDELRRDGKLGMPSRKDELLGGHAICIVGYDNIKKYFICRNSFGEDWGDKGYFYMPHDYAEYYCMDAWMFDIKLL
jgi:C1A family cysteine protease